MHRFDKARHTSLVAKRETQAANGRVQAVFEIDEGALGPKAAAQLVAPDDIALRLNQRREDAERLFLETNADAALAQLARSEVHLEGTELENPAEDRMRLHRPGLIRS